MTGRPASWGCCRNGAETSCSLNWKLPQMLSQPLIHLPGWQGRLQSSCHRDDIITCNTLWYFMLLLLMLDFKRHLNFTAKRCTVTDLRSAQDTPAQSTWHCAPVVRRRLLPRPSSLTLGEELRCEGDS